MAAWCRCRRRGRALYIVGPNAHKKGWFFPGLQKKKQALNSLLFELPGIWKQEFPDSVETAWGRWLDHNFVERLEGACARALMQIQKDSAHKRLCLN